MIFGERFVTSCLRACSKGEAVFRKGGERLAWLREVGSLKPL